MDINNMKKGVSVLRLENMTKVYNKKGEIDPTLLRATFSILDFSQSGNKQIVPKQVGIDCLNTLVHKPLLCKYIETTDYNNPNDDFGDHDEKIIKLRNGEDYISTGTTAIGVCENAYIGVTKNDSGEDIDCIMGDFLLWLYRYPNEVSLINEFFENGKPLYTSCEHYYKTSGNDENSNEIVDSLIFDGHCLLGRGIEPAYNSSRLISFNSIWEKAINNKINNSKKEVTMEKNNIIFEMLKSNNAISANSYSWKIYESLSEVMVAKDFNSIYISNYDIFPEERYFLMEVFNDGYKLFKVTFEIGEDEKITVDYEGKVEVEYKYSIQPVEELQKQLNEKEVVLVAKEEELKSINEKIATLEGEVESKSKEIETLQTSLNAKEEEIKTSLNSKTELDSKLNESNEMVISLNAKIGELESEIETYKPIVEAHQEEEYQKVVNSISEEYREKFDKVNAIDIFESDEVQDIINKSVNKKDLTINKEFKTQLNQMIVDNIKGKIKIEDTIPPTVKSINSVVRGKENKDLAGDFVDTFEEKYGFKR